MLISFNRCFKNTESTGFMQAATNIDNLRPVLGQPDANLLVRKHLELAFAVHGNRAGSGLKCYLIFQRHQPVLMDFDVSQHHGITFVYVLPFSETEALVEPTVLSYLPLDPRAYTELIRNYLFERFDLNDYDVLFQEQGIIPMTAELAPPKMATRIIPIGTASGMVKGSTGYGFLAIQKWSRAVAQRIAKGGYRRLPQPRSQLSTYMDRIFLSFIEAHPSEAPKVFFRLFQRVPPNRLVRFLSDSATPGDIARVIAAMPKRPFIRQAARVAVAREASS
jgi:lycopene beta-cyclase